MLPPDTVLNHFDPDPTTSLGALLPLIQVKTLVMHGGQDQNVAISEAENLVSKLRNGTLYIFKGRGHLPNITAADEFCEVLRKFIVSA